MTRRPDEEMRQDSWTWLIRRTDNRTVQLSLVHLCPWPIALFHSATTYCGHVGQTETFIVRLHYHWLWQRWVRWSAEVEEWHQFHTLHRNSDSYSAPSPSHPILMVHVLLNFDQRWPSWSEGDEERGVNDNGFDGGLQFVEVIPHYPSSFSSSTATTETLDVHLNISFVAAASTKRGGRAAK